jgi:dephospho-CoA kinase
LQGLPPERAHLIFIGNELRTSGGPGVLARAILNRLGDRDVVDSIRNPGEVEVLRTLPHFLLVGVRAAVEIRFQRCLDRRRPGDPSTLEEFRSREAEENSEDVARQQLNATFALADWILENDGDLGQLKRSVMALVARA